MRLRDCQSTYVIWKIAFVFINLYIRTISSDFSLLAQSLQWGVRVNEVVDANESGLGTIEGSGIEFIRQGGRLCWF